MFHANDTVKDLDLAILPYRNGAIYRASAAQVSFCKDDACYYDRHFPFSATPIRFAMGYSTFGVTKGWTSQT